jgi:predicted extracellular nuclease
VSSNGFWFQDPQPDDNPATSEGVFVFTSSAPTVSVGDALSVEGSVAEFRRAAPAVRRT